MRLGLCVAALACLAQSGSGRLPGVEVEDQLDVVQVDRRLLLIDVRDQRRREFELDIGERVLGIDTRGLMAVVRTSDRLLGVSTELSTWQELRYQVAERASPPERVFLGDRVALVAFPNRLAGLSTTSGGWQELPIGARESRGATFTGTNLVVVITDRRVLAFAPGLTRFAELGLTPNEDIEDVSVRENSAAVTTSRRILIFRVGTGRWTALTRSARGN